MHLTSKVPLSVELYLVMYNWSLLGNGMGCGQGLTFVSKKQVCWNFRVLCALVALVFVQGTFYNFVFHSPLLSTLTPVTWGFACLSGFTCCRCATTGIWGTVAEHSEHLSLPTRWVLMRFPELAFNQKPLFFSLWVSHWNMTPPSRKKLPSCSCTFFLITFFVFL